MNNSRRPDQQKRRFTNKNGIDEHENISCGQCGKKFSHVARREPSPLKSDTSQVVNVGDYVINISHTRNTNQSFIAYNNVTKEEKIAKILNIQDYTRLLSAYSVIGQHDNINNVEKIFVTKNKGYVMFKKQYGDLHAYMKKNQRLKETEARFLFQQIIQSVRHCHQNNVVVQEIKLKKFVFADQYNQRIQLDSLEEGVVLGKGQSDWFRERHGCLAYISPEILNSAEGYSGKAADCWSLGVLLYIMLTGKYPFFDTNSTSLFKKICKGAFYLPNFLSAKASCLILNLLRLKPGDRMTSDEILNHPWFTADDDDSSPPAKKSRLDSDQEVPNVGRTHYQEEHKVSKNHSVKPFHQLNTDIVSPVSNQLHTGRWQSSNI